MMMGNGAVGPGAISNTMGMMAPMGPFAQTNTASAMNPMQTMGIMTPMGMMTPMNMMNPVNVCAAVNVMGQAGSVGSGGPTFGPMSAGSSCTGGTSRSSPYCDGGVDRRPVVDPAVHTHQATSMDKGDAQEASNVSCAQKARPPLGATAPTNTVAAMDPVTTSAPVATAAACTGDTGCSSSSKSTLSAGAAGAEYPPEKIFVARLPKTATEENVREHFSRYGPVARVELKMGEDGCRGFGFVTFVNRRSAQDVAQNYEGNRFQGRWVACEACVPQTGRKEDKYYSRGDPLTAPERIFIGGLPRDITEERIRHRFSEFGSIIDVEMKYDESGSFRGFGFITFKDKSTADYICEHHMQTMLEGRMINCKRPHKFERVSRAELEDELKKEAEEKTKVSHTQGHVQEEKAGAMGMNMGMMNMMGGGMGGNFACNMGTAVPCGMGLGVGSMTGQMAGMMNAGIGGAVANGLPIASAGAGNCRMCPQVIGSGSHIMPAVMGGALPGGMVSNPNTSFSALGGLSMGMGNPMMCQMGGFMPGSMGNCSAGGALGGAIGSAVGSPVAGFGGAMLNCMPGAMSPCFASPGAVGQAIPGSICAGMCGSMSGTISGDPKAT